MTTATTETGETETHADDGLFEQETQQETQQQTTQESQQAQQTQQSSGVTREDLMEFGRTLVQPKQEQQRQLTPEEIDQKLAVWNPKDDLWDRMSNPETRKEAFLELRNGLVQQALTGAHLMTQRTQQEFEGRLSPIQQFAQEQRVTALRTSFMESNPGLANHAKILPMVSAMLEKSGYKPTSVEEGFKKLASEAEKFIKENIDSNFSLTSQENTTQTQTQKPGTNGAPRMATTTSVRGGSGVAKAPMRGATDSEPDGGIWS